MRGRHRPTGARARLGGLVVAATLAASACFGTAAPTPSPSPRYAGASVGGASNVPPAAPSDAVTGESGTPTPVASNFASAATDLPFTPSPVGPPAEPDPAMTPGATDPRVTQATIRSTICVAGYTATVRPPASYTTTLKRQQITAYGYADTSLVDYEEDHLVPLELGGAPADPGNLWPQPRQVSLADGTFVGASVKDGLEDHLHGQVCDGQVPLAVAQREIALDWIGAWEYAGRPKG
ncbi:MAG TPA: hypothetical protein VF763_09045 [Candidatus Limnocylindrales bacterium]